MSLIERLSGSAVGNQTGSHALPRTVDAYTESVSPSVLSRGGKKRNSLKVSDIRVGGVSQQVCLQESPR